MAFQSRFLALLCVLPLFAAAHAPATCQNPVVRKEWRALSTTERAEWIAGVKCLAHQPHDPALTPSVDPALSLIPPINPNSSFWDDISYMHSDLNLLIHYTGYFLPWHRAYVWAVEKSMKDKCGYKGVQPYWNWTIDAPDVLHSSLWDDNAESGLGGWGDLDNDIQITTGGFAKDFPLAYPVPHTLRRNYTLQPFLNPIGPSPFTIDPAMLINTTFDQTNVDYLLNGFVGDHDGFQAYFESIFGPHPGPHIIIGGDMSGGCPAGATACVQGPKWTPNEPMFFLHHAMVDKVWHDWQHKDPSNFYAFSGGSVSEFTNTTLYNLYPTGGPPFLNFSSPLPNDGMLWENLTIWDVMDTNNDLLCYTYQ